MAERTINNSRWRDRIALVTGGSGFKGAWLCGTLHELGAKVFATVSNHIDPDSAYALLGLADKIHQFHVDITNRDRVCSMFKEVNPNDVFHLAAKALVPVCLRDPGLAYSVNVMGTINVLEGSRNLANCDCLQITSTDHVFGPTDPSAIPLVEESPVGFGGPYETSKAMMELAVRSHHATYRKELPRILITRGVNAFGYGDINPRRIIPEFVSNAVQRGVVSYKTRLNGRQYLHVADAVSGYISAVSKIQLLPDSGNTPTFHFALESFEGSSESFIRVKALAELIAGITGASTREKDGCMDFMPNENPVQGLSCTATRQQLGWSPSQDFTKSLEDLANWYKPTTSREMRKELIMSAVSDCARHLADSLD